LPFEKMPLLVTQSTLPYVSTPYLGSPEHRTHGFGDFTLLAAFFTFQGGVCFLIASYLLLPEMFSE